MNDRETWLPDPWTNCMTLFDVGDARATQLVIEANGLPRRLTCTETERLFGLPDGWTDSVFSNNVRLRLLANAVVVPMATWVGEQIMSVASSSSHH